MIEIFLITKDPWIWFIRSDFPRTCAGENHIDPQAASQSCCETGPQAGAFLPRKTKRSCFEGQYKKVILFTVHYASKAIDILFRQKRTQNRLAAAHSRRRLMLLGSPPDMVHSRLLRRTDLSQPDSTDRQCQQAPSRAHITPAIADFRQQGAAKSPASTAKRITFKCLPL